MGGDWVLSLQLRYALHVRLLMAAQKNVLFVGAPGVGKTRLAREAARTVVEPVLVTGRDGLTYERLVAYYEKVNGGFQLSLGELSRAVISSWLLLACDLTPQHLVIDEINRCNVDVLLGETFTAMDIAHRMYVTVIRNEAYHLVVDVLERISKGDKDAIKRLGLEEYIGYLGDMQKRVESLLNGFRRLGGIPFPYSFRILATINIYDRANLYRVGWALQRRFATLYVVAPYEELKPKLAKEELKKLENRLDKRVLDILQDPKSSVYGQAVRELLADKKIEESLVEADNPTMPVYVDETLVENARNSIPGEYNDLFTLVAYIYNIARQLRVELGIAPLVDLAKLLLVYKVLNVEAIREDELVDLALSTLILPLLGVAAPRIRSELLLGASKGYQTIKKLQDTLASVLGSETLSARVVESYDLPYFTTS